VIGVRLGRALDWRVRAVTSRLDETVDRLGRLERGLDALAARVERLVGLSERALADGAATRELLDERVEPLLRAVVAEESENRRRLFAARAADAYGSAYDRPNPLISVTVAAGGRIEPLVRRALPSLLNQTHENLEVIVVGDAVSGELAAAVASLGDERVRFANLSQRVVAHPDPARHWLVGSTMARNEAARAARGQWLLHFDDDDSLRPRAIELLLELARAQRVEVAYGGFEQHAPEGSVTRGAELPLRDETFGWQGFGWQGALVHGQLGFFERELVAAQIGQPGDAYLLERMLRSGVRFAMLDAVVWDYYPSTLWNASSASSVSAHVSSTTDASSSE
jgi:hypothetical protein